MKVRSFSQSFGVIILVAILGLVAMNQTGFASCCKKDSGGGDHSSHGADKGASQSLLSETKGSCCASKSGGDSDVEAKADAAESHGQSERKGMGRRGGGKGMNSRGGGHGPGAGLMADAHQLVFSNQSIERVIEEIPGGVKTITTTSDPDLVVVLRRHPREMYERMATGHGVRRWDPVFRELARHASKIEMQVKDIENGVEVVETSEDPMVASLIRAHAYKVSEFVKRGMEAMHEATELPEGYKQPALESGGAQEHPHAGHH